MRKWLRLAPSGARVWFECYGFWPTRSGAYYTPNIFTQKVGAGPATPGTTLRAWCALLPSDSVVGYVGTTSKLYEYATPSTFTDRSKGGGYTGTATDWSFAQYGNITLATNRVDNLQTRDSTGGVAFADATGSPAKARIVLTQAEQVLLFNLNDGAEKPDAFAACAPGDYTDWSGAGATTPTRIRHRPGGIVAAIPFRDYVLVFKRSSVYKLTYTGSAFKWRTELIAIGRGAYGKHDVLNCGDVVVFTGPGGAWLFDGASFRSISDYVGDINQLQTGTTGCFGSFFSPLSQNAVFLGNGTAAAYNLVSDAWGRSSPQMAGAFVGNMSANYKAMTGEPAALAAFIAPTAENPDLFWQIDLESGTNSVIKADGFWGTGSGTTSAFLSGGIEGEGGRKITYFSGVDVDYTMSLPYSAADITPGDTELRLDVYTGGAKDSYSLNPRNGAATPASADVASSTEQMRFDFLKSAVYARFRIKVPDTAGYVEIDDYAPTTQQAGKL